MSREEYTLLHSGFNQHDLHLLKQNIVAPDGTLDGVVAGFAKRFMVYTSLFLTCLLGLVVLAIVTPVKDLILVAAGMGVVFLTLRLMRSPIVSLKCWFYCSHQWR